MLLRFISRSDPMPKYAGPQRLHTIPRFRVEEHANIEDPRVSPRWVVFDKTNVVARFLMKREALDYARWKNAGDGVETP